MGVRNLATKHVAFDFIGEVHATEVTLLLSQTVSTSTTDQLRSKRIKLNYAHPKDILDNNLND